LIPTTDIIPPNGKLPSISSIALEQYSVDILRLDTIHETIHGNKWFKLKNAIAYCLAHNLKGIISFGGAYSNHLHALSYACPLFNLNSIGIVNGTNRTIFNTPTLTDCSHAGMQLYLGGYNAYKNITTLQDIVNVDTSMYYVMPMGGGDALSIAGAGDICQFIAADYTDIWIAAGSGTTVAGLLKQLAPQQHLHIVSTIKHNKELETSCKNIIRDNYTIYDYNITGKFGKINSTLTTLMHMYRIQYDIEFDAMYTIHVMHYLMNNVQHNKGNKIMMIHTGGLQGNRSIF
jgi:1-aminocyclopropane-1-carboxylate deaminase